MAFNSLFEVLKKVREQYPVLSKRMSQAEALGRWNLAVGELIAKHTRAIRVKDAILWVEVDHPIWKSELHYRKKQILDILNQDRGPSVKTLETLKDIYFVDTKN